MSSRLKLMIFMYFKFNILDKCIIQSLIIFIKTEIYNFIQTFIFQTDLQIKITKFIDHSTRERMIHYFISVLFLSCL